ncbi:MAG: hypothetical protein KAI79_01930 [Bacteroidales bacterium]|nr:hypothetical protein [Bacteroidales bacterium]
MRRIALTSILLFVFITFTDAQRWKQYRYAIFGGVGTANFMGDLGGGSKDASHFMGIRDLDGASTRPNFHVGMRYKLLSMVAVKTQFNYAFLNGSDEKSGSLGRLNRNLAFKTPVFEWSTQLEYFFMEEKVSSRYQISSGFKNLLSAYIFMGVGAFYFNPKAQGPDGEWYALQPLGTEGQGWVSDYYSSYDSSLITVSDRYKRVQAILPLGIGIKYTLTRNLSLGAELSARYTSTDYLDDASSNYFNFYEAIDNNLMEGNPDDFALNAYFADRHIAVTDWTTMESVNPDENPAEWEEHRYDLGKPYRGSPSYNDAYMFLNITLYYRLSSTRGGLPKFK